MHSLSSLSCSETMSLIAPFFLAKIPPSLHFCELHPFMRLKGLPRWHYKQRIHLQCRRDVGLIPGSGRSPEQEMAVHSVFLPGKSHGQRNLVGYSPWSRELDATEHTHNHTTQIQHPLLQEAPSPSQAQAQANYLCGTPTTPHVCTPQMRLMVLALSGHYHRT